MPSKSKVTFNHKLRSKSVHQRLGCKSTCWHSSTCLLVSLSAPRRPTQSKDLEREILEPCRPSTTSTSIVQLASQLKPFSTSIHQRLGCRSTCWHSSTCLLVSLSAPRRPTQSKDLEREILEPCRPSTTSTSIVQLASQLKPSWTSIHQRLGCRSTCWHSSTCLLASLLSAPRRPTQSKDLEREILEPCRPSTSYQSFSLQANWNHLGQVFTSVSAAGQHADIAALACWHLSSRHLDVPPKARTLSGRYWSRVALQHRINRSACKPTETILDKYSPASRLQVNMLT